MPNAAGVALEAAAPATNPRRKQLHLGTSAAAPADGASATAPSRSSGSSSRSRSGAAGATGSSGGQTSRAASKPASRLCGPRNAVAGHAGGGGPRRSGETGGGGPPLAAGRGSTARRGARISGSGPLPEAEEAAEQEGRR